MDYALRLGIIERLKAKERQLATQNNNAAKAVSQNSDTQGRTDDIIAAQLGFGSRDTYRKEKYIVENKEYLSPEDFADWDVDKLSTNKAFNKIKAEKEALELKVKDLESREPEVSDKAN